MGKLISDIFEALPLDIEILPNCRSETVEIIERSGIEMDFADAFDTRIRYLKKYKHLCVHVQPKKFKKCNGYKNQYEIKFKLETNIRILFTFIDNIAILLCAFVEKKDSDYKRANRLAEMRIKQLKRGV